VNIQILDAAERDLIEGYYFYEKQSQGLGQYFLDAIYADIESLYLYFYTHPEHFGYHPVTCETIPVCYLLPRCGAIYQNIRNYRLSTRPGINPVEININSFKQLAVSYWQKKDFRLQIVR